MKKIFTLTIFAILILLSPYNVKGAEKIIINNISLDDFTKAPLMENETGDLTLLESDKYKFYYYPSENYFFLGLFEPQYFRKALADISIFLSVDLKKLCQLPIKITSLDTEAQIHLCTSPLIVDFDNDGKPTSLDLTNWINQYKKNTKINFNSFLDINFDNSVNSLDYSLVFEKVFQKIPLDNN